MSRHELLSELHRLLQPRTYFEIGVQTGASLALSRATSIGVDPKFAVTHELHCDLQLLKSTSDDFFSGHAPFEHLGGTPIDLAFIDGMHLSDFALRDFINTEPHLAPSGVAVFDDVLPRNALEAARGRRTRAWAGDVFKAVEILEKHRPDLTVVLINTAPTGTAVVVGVDPGSQVLNLGYASYRAYLEAEDPQSPPERYLTRAVAVDPIRLLESPAWSMLRQARETGDTQRIAAASDLLRALPRYGTGHPG